MCLHGKYFWFLMFAYIGCVALSCSNATQIRVVETADHYNQYKEFLEFTQEANQSVPGLNPQTLDLVIMVDDSTSMEPYVNRLLDEFGHLGTQLAPHNWRGLVVGTAWNHFFKTFGDPSPPQGVQLKDYIHPGDYPTVNDVRMGIIDAVNVLRTERVSQMNNSAMVPAIADDERPIASLVTLLRSPDLNISLRSGADLHVLYISDEDACGEANPNYLFSYQDLANPPPVTSPDYLSWVIFEQLHRPRPAPRVAGQPLDAVGPWLSILQFLLGMQGVLRDSDHFHVPCRQDYDAPDALKSALGGSFNKFYFHSIYRQSPLSRGLDYLVRETKGFSANFLEFETNQQAGRVLENLGRFLFLKQEFVFDDLPQLLRNYSSEYVSAHDRGFDVFVNGQIMSDSVDYTAFRDGSLIKIKFKQIPDAGALVSLKWRAQMTLIDCFPLNRTLDFVNSSELIVTVNGVEAPFYYDPVKASVCFHQAPPSEAVVRIHSRPLRN